MIKKGLTEQQACQLVLGHLDDLKRLCNNRFPGDSILAEQAENYVLETLKADNWRRVLHWDHTCQFQTFFLAITGRLLTDFWRKEFGHFRPPEWLKREQDPIWIQAYDLIIQKNNSRGDAIEILLVNNASRERAFIESVVSRVIAHCKTHQKPASSPLEEHEPWLTASNPGPLAELESNENQGLVTALFQVLGWSEVQEPEIPAKLSSQIEQLKSSLKLTGEDKLIVKMHILEGRKLSEIQRMLNFRGDIHKRYKKVLKHLKDAMIHVGLIQGK